MISDYYLYFVGNVCAGRAVAIFNLKDPKTIEPVCNAYYLLNLQTFIKIQFNQPCIQPVYNLYKPGLHSKVLDNCTLLMLINVQVFRFI